MTKREAIYNAIKGWDWENDISSVCTQEQMKLLFDIYPELERALQAYKSAVDNMAAQQCYVEHLLDRANMNEYTETGKKQ